MPDMGSEQEDQTGIEEREARRQFLARCGRFAAVTPPAMTMLLAVSATPLEAYASTILGNDPADPSRPKRPRKPGKPRKPKLP
jgi:hypothetical protein